MFENLSIKYFRGIRSLELNDLEKVNILVGTNNSCKSTILDAIYLIRSTLMGNAEKVEPSSIERLIHRISREKILNIRDLWFNYKEENEIAIDFKCLNTYHLTFKLNINEALCTWNIDKDKKLFSVSLGFNSMHYFTIVEFEPEASDDFFRTAKHIIDSGIMKSDSFKLVCCVTELKFLKNLQLLDDYLLGAYSYIDKKFGQSLIQDDLDEKFRLTLEFPYNMKYKHISYSPRPNGQSDMIVKGKENTILTRHHGSGFVNTLNLLLYCQNSIETVLLIEEPEIHQHPFAIRNLINAIIDIAFNNKLQLFITTHNADLVAEAVRRKSGVKVFLLDRNEKGDIGVTPFDRYSAALNVSLGIDLRTYQLIPILVEGTSDSNILSEVIRKIYNKSPEELGVQFVPAQNKEKCTRFVLHSHVMAGHPLIIVMPDYDHETQENITKNIESDIKRTWKQKSSSYNTESITYTINSKTIKVLIEPLGVIDDDELNNLKNDLKITNAVLEDSLFFILLKDESLREKINATWKDKSEFIKNIKEFKFPDSKTSKISLKCYYEEFLDSHLFNAKIIETDLIRLTSIDIIKNCFKPLITTIKNTTGV